MCWSTLSWCILLALYNFSSQTWGLYVYLCVSVRGAQACEKLYWCTQVCWLCCPVLCSSDNSGEDSAFERQNYNHVLCGSGARLHGLYLGLAWTSTSRQFCSNNTSIQGSNSNWWNKRCDPTYLENSPAGIYSWACRGLWIDHAGREGVLWRGSRDLASESRVCTITKAEGTLKRKASLDWISGCLRAGKLENVCTVCSTRSPYALLTVHKCEAKCGDI